MKIKTIFEIFNNQLITNMRKTLLLLSLSIFLYGQAQILKTINVTTPGDLSSLLTENEKNLITSLTVTGTIDVRDFKCMRDQMPVLSNIDLSESNVAEYNGGAVTYPYMTNYPANELPAYSFRNYYTSLAKTTLNSIILPKTLISIGRSAFSTCPNLATIEINNSITTIGENAFIGCYGLTKVKMGSSVTTIGSYAFQYCSALNDLTIGDHVTNLGIDVFDDCSSLTKVIIPNSITTLRSSMFSDCTKLTEITIPSSVTTIESGAFGYCTALKTIYSLNPIPPTCIGFCFTLVAASKVYVPASSVSAYKSALVWSDCFYSQITAIPSTDIIIPTNSNVKVFANHSEIIINGTNNGDVINIYALTGKLIQKIQSSGEQINIPFQTNNIYIVKIENETFKISL